MPFTCCLKKKAAKVLRFPAAKVFAVGKMFPYKATTMCIVLRGVAVVCFAESTDPTTVAEPGAEVNQAIYRTWTDVLKIGERKIFLVNIFQRKQTTKKTSGTIGRIKNSNNTLYWIFVFLLICAWKCQFWKTLSNTGLQSTLYSRL